MTWLRFRHRAVANPPSHLLRLCLGGKAATIAEIFIMNDCLGTLINCSTVARRGTGMRAAPVEVLDLQGC